MEGNEEGQYEKDDDNGFLIHGSSRKIFAARNI